MGRWSKVSNNWDSALVATVVSLLIWCIILLTYNSPNFKDDQILDISVKVNQDDFLESHDKYALIYNRIPKTGSSSMLHMLGALQERNNYHYTNGIFGHNAHLRHLNMSMQLKYAKKLRNIKKKYFPKPIVCNKHVHYIDFTKHGVPRQPIYFNTVRDPYDRFKSRYYWHRADFQAKSWFEDYHMIEPDADPRKRDYWEWKNKTFEECVLDFNDRECHITDGSMRDYAIPYFCGQELECTRHNSHWALERAIENVERHYPVVGVLEEMDSTLRVMQAVLPRFFGGIHDKFGGNNTLHQNKQSYIKDSPTQEKENFMKKVETILKDQLITEYEFYNYVKRRLAGQADTLSVQ